MWGMNKCGQNWEGKRAENEAQPPFSGCAYLNLPENRPTFHGGTGAFRAPLTGIPGAQAPFRSS